MLFPVLREWLGQGKVPASTRALTSDSWTGFGYAPTPQFTWGENKADPIANEFADYVEGGLKANGIVYAIERVRCGVFAEARFQFQELRGGRPGDLFGTQDLSILERPWEGGTTGDLLAGMLLDADLSGNAYRIRVGDEIVRLRPDWVEIILTDRMIGYAGEEAYLGYKKLGYLYWHGGRHSGNEPVILDAAQVSHFAPMPDPNANFRGMSWVTPVVREIQADKQGTEHKARLFENSATPNLHIALDVNTQEKFDKWVQIYEEKHGGASNAYKNLYTAAGTAVTPVGGSMQQLDYKAVIGAGETRLAAAAGVHPVILGLSEGMQGSSLNAGNYTAAKRNFVDSTMRPLWRNVCGSLEQMVALPSVNNGTARLWYDDRDIAFLREDTQDRANVAQTHAITIRNLVDAGYEPSSVIDAVKSEDMSRLVHSGLFSVQLQAAGTTPPPPEAPRTDVTIAEGAIRAEIHPAPVEVDARVMPGAVNASSSNNSVEAQRDAIQGALFEAIPAVVEQVRAADRDAESDRLDAVADMNRAVVDAVSAQRETLERLADATERAAQPRTVRKTVETDEIGRITAVVEEQI